MKNKNAVKKDRIVFLDAGTVDYGDISFSELQALGSFIRHTHSGPAEILERLSSARIAITNKCAFDRGIIEALPQLECVCVAATGVNIIDLGAAKKKGIALTNVPGYSTESVVQFTIAFILALSGRLIPHNQAAHDGSWSKSIFFTYGGFPFSEVAGKTLGILGYGTIGRRVGEVAKALGMRILAGKIPGRKYDSVKDKARVSLDKLLADSDYLTIHAPLTPFTQNLIEGKRISKMKKGAFLINMARGGIVNEGALLKALSSGYLAGAATDVLSEEPPALNHPLLKASNLLMTPHVAWASRESRHRLLHEVALNIQAFQQGHKRNRIV